MDLGDYCLIKKRGSGFLGSTFLAEQRYTKKSYYLKLLAPELTQDGDFLINFETKLSVLAQINHPVLAKLHTISKDKEHYFFVHEMEEGSINLESYTKQRNLTEKEIYALLEQVAEALDFLHSHSLIHGSLKLSNVIISSEGRVTLTEVGLATLVDSALPKRAMLLENNPSEELLSFCQTLSFSSPEQRLNYVLSCQSDIYAFGVLCYYLLMNHYPEGIFPMPSSQKRSYFYDWDELISACLAWDPSKRASALLPLMKKIHASVIAEEPLRVAIDAKEAATLSSFLKEAEESEKLVAVGVSAQQEYEKALHNMLHKEPVVSEYHPQPSALGTITPLITPVKQIPAGKYCRGCFVGNRDEAPQHEIFLDAYAIDIHPVTNDQFVRFLECMGGEKDRNYNDMIRLKDSRISRSAGKLAIESGYANHPVVGITWYGAVAYAEWIGKRLPTEAEWEVAASGGVKNRLFPTGEGIEKTEANFFSSDTAEVMSYPANEFGLYDMAGNVYEWCHDWYLYNYYENSAIDSHNPKGPQQGVYRVLRGGCWKSLREDLRTCHRHRNNPGTMNSTYGFRCAQDVRG